MIYLPTTEIHVNRPAPRGTPLRRALDALADLTAPASCEELLRRRLIALVARSGLPVTEVARRIGMAHGLLVRKLNGPDAAPSDRRPLDDETIGKVLEAIEVEPDALVTLAYEVGDESILQILTESVQESRRQGASRYLANKVRLPIADVKAKRVAAGDTSAKVADRLRRLAALGFLDVQTDGGDAVTAEAFVGRRSLPPSWTLAATASGWACAAR